MPDTLGSRIRSAREASGFTQEFLAEKTGVSRTAVAKWESGEAEPKLRHLAELSLLLDVSTDYLLGVNRTCGSASDLSDEALIHLKSFIKEIKKSAQDK